MFFPDTMFFAAGDTIDITEQTINGGTGYGKAVVYSMDGSRVAISNYSATSSTGIVDIFVKSGTSFTLEQTLTASDATINDQFGFSLAFNEGSDTIVIGANSEDGAGNNRGAVYVFTRSVGVWTEEQKITASDTQDSDDFGNSVALSIDGDTLVVGSHLEDTIASNAGAVYVFTRSVGVWTEEQKITASDGTSGDFFGRVVTIGGATGDTIVVSSEFNTSGQAYIYIRTAGVWTEEQKITGVANSGIYFSTYGVALGDFNGDTLVISAPYDSSIGTNQGAVYVYTRTAGVWQASVDSYKIVEPTSVNDNNFGSHVSINKDGTFIGIATSVTANSFAYVYQLIGNDWIVQRTVQPTPDNVLTMSLNNSIDFIVGTGSPWFGGGSGTAHIYQPGTEVI